MKSFLVDMNFLPIYTEIHSKVNAVSYFMEPDLKYENYFNP